jgi:hypothetical protein
MISGPAATAIGGAILLGRTLFGVGAPLAAGTYAGAKLTKGAMDYLATGQQNPRVETPPAPQQSSPQPQPPTPPQPHVASWAPPQRDDKFSDLGERLTASRISAPAPLSPEEFEQTRAAVNRVGLDFNFASPVFDDWLGQARASLNRSLDEAMASTSTYMPRPEPETLLDRSSPLAET